MEITVEITLLQKKKKNERQNKKRETESYTSHFDFTWCKQTRFDAVHVHVGYHVMNFIRVEHLHVSTMPTTSTHHVFSLMQPIFCLNQSNATRSVKSDFLQAYYIILILKNSCFLAFRIQARPIFLILYRYFIVAKKAEPSAMLSAYLLAYVTYNMCY